MLNIAKNALHTLLIVLCMVLGFGVMAALSGCGTTHPVYGSCTVSRENSVSTIRCPDGTSSEISDGANGEDGENGRDGTNGADGVDSILAVIDPCGQQAAHDEVLLRLSNGKLLASFSDSASGLNTRFAYIGPGSYVTTDGTNCRFTVDGNLNVSF